jgi:hypothetical protein
MLFLGHKKKAMDSDIQKISRLAKIKAAQAQVNRNLINSQRDEELIQVINHQQQRLLEQDRQLAEQKSIILQLQQQMANTIKPKNDAAIKKLQDRLDFVKDLIAEQKQSGFMPAKFWQQYVATQSANLNLFIKPTDVKGLMLSLNYKYSQHLVNGSRVRCWEGFSMPDVVETHDNMMSPNFSGVSSPAPIYAQSTQTSTRNPNLPTIPIN